MAPMWTGMLQLLARLQRTYHAGQLPAGVAGRVALHVAEPATRTPTEEALVHRALGRCPGGAGLQRGKPLR